MQPTYKNRIDALRAWLKKNELDAFFVPHEDEFLGEYIPPHNERLRWTTGFTGSAGAAIITQEKAAIFVDGRYSVQVRKQVNADIFEYQHLIETPPTQWIFENLDKNSKIAIDNRMHSEAWFSATSKKLEGTHKLICIDENPIDSLWKERPFPHLSHARLMAENLSGKKSAEKRKEIAEIILNAGADAAFLSQLDSICWLLNIRGQDIPCLPVLLSSAIIYKNGNVTFFIDPQRLPEDFHIHTGKGVNVLPPEKLKETLTSLSGKRVLLDPQTSSAWINQLLKENNALIIQGSDPCLLTKAVKNKAEIEGFKACHIRDGVAVSRFLAWLEEQIKKDHLLSEEALSDKLYHFRKENEHFVEPSFDTISAAGKNAAMCHYNHKNQNETNTLERHNVYLVDSGGQYPDGTTDITRTVGIGECSDEIKRAFTLVLKGHIALSEARFPRGTVGSQLDTLARQFLWQHGLDYDHGTGHGVGHFLSVHEGPQRIGKAYNSTALLPGMILSNEPGYYPADAFGIRIENLELVVKISISPEINVLGFESLTRVPIDKNLLEKSLLTENEKRWWNNYHKHVWKDISPSLKGNDLIWLKKACSPLSD